MKPTLPVLTDRALNRATLARQLLLERAALAPMAAVHHLVGLQAQNPEDPYVALWSRLDGFTTDALSEALVARAVVRIVVMRGTIHLVTAGDCLLLRPLLQPVLTRELERHPEHAPALVGVDLKKVLAFARKRLAERPLTHPELKAAFAEKFPELSPGALVYACRNHLALIQTPPRGVWGASAQITSSTAEIWLGRPLVARPSIDDVVLRYLRAFGPARTADVAAWSGLSGMPEVMKRLRPKLIAFADARGRELLDVEDAPRPDPSTPAPPRFLPEYDNALLSHADRSRFITDEVRKGLFSAPNGRIDGAVLVDGVVRAGWRIDAEARALIVKHLDPLPARTKADLGAEGERLLTLHGVSDYDVRFEKKKLAPPASS